MTTANSEKEPLKVFDVNNSQLLLYVDCLKNCGQDKGFSIAGKGRDYTSWRNIDWLITDFVVSKSAIGDLVLKPVASNNTNKSQK